MKESEMSTISRSLTALALAGVLSGGAYAATSPDDAQISAAVREQINEKPSLKFYNISVRTVHGVVYLEGLVDTTVDQGEAEAIAGAVPGVAKVYDELAVSGNG
jgi:osmotically-inducible protein OsmY